MSALSAPLRRRGRGVPRYLGSAAVCAGLIVVTLAVAYRMKSPSAVGILSVIGFVGIGSWMFVSERYRVSLAIVLLYLGLLDGYIKLSTGNTYATVGRDILLYSVVGGALARLSLRRQPLTLPPLSGWLLAWVLVVLVCVANPGSYPLPHALAGVRQHVEFVPLFFFGYLIMRDPRHLRVFLVLLLVCGAANGVVNAIQYNLTPDQLAAWGPGYNKFINGGSEGESRVRPFGLGGDAGGGGVIAMLAVPAALALVASAWKRPKHAALAMVLAVGVAVAVVTSQGRGVVVTAFVSVFAYAALTVTPRRLVPTLAGLAVVGVIAALVVSSVAKQTGGSGSFSRYDTISPTEVLSTTKADRGYALSIVPTYIARFPLGHGLATGGPATGFFRKGPTDPSLSAESEFSFLVLEVGIIGLIVLVGFTLRLLWLGITRVRQIADHELRTLLAAVIAPLFAVLALYVTGPATAGSPLAPYLWFAAGVISYWLIETRRRRPLTPVVAAATGAMVPAEDAMPDPPPPPVDHAAAAAAAAAAAPAARDVPRPVVAIAYRCSDGSTDAILAHSRNLAAGLEATGEVDSTLIIGTPGKPWKISTGGTAKDLVSAAAGVDGLLVQYNPFSYGRWGFAPWLPRDLRRLKKARLPLAVMVHEAYVRPTTPRHRLLSVWQRLQLRTVLRIVDVAFASTESLVRTLRADTRTPVHHLPVSSNLPERRQLRSVVRDRLGIGLDAVVLVAFGTGHPSQLQASVGRAARAVCEAGHETVLLNLGAGAAPVPGVPEAVRVHTPGKLNEEELAEWLSAGDIFVAPFSDGVSTRRTTVMAALQHGLPVVTTRGANTDRVLLQAQGALRLVDAWDPAHLERAVIELAEDPTRRSALADAGNSLYRDNFAWPVIAWTFVNAVRASWPQIRESSDRAVQVSSSEGTSR
jgi:glycosyltransferase involved in cell wall biosynthesis